TLCSLLLHPVLGLPFARQTIAKSARSDDLISGTDFLSVFIGASIPRSRAVNRSRNFDKHIDSFTSEGSYIEETTVLDTLTSLNDSTSLPAEIFGDSSSILPINFHEGTEEDRMDEISTGYADLSTTEAFETHTLNTEAQESPLPNSSLDGTNTRIVDVESVDANSKRTDSAPKSSSEKIDFEHNKERYESNISFTPSSNIMTFSDNSNSFTFGLEDMFAFPNNSNILSHKESETNSKYSSISKVPVENKAFSMNPTLSEGNKTADFPSLETTEENGKEDQTHKVVSVRISSSVALGAAQDSKYDRNNRRFFNNFLDSFSHNTDRGAHGPSAGSISLVTEEQPAATAIQRSQFSVEEASPSSSIISVHQESSSSNVQSRQSVLPFRRPTEVPSNPQSSPVRYHTSVSTATSGSRVQFHSEPPSYHRPAVSVAETVQRRVVAKQPQRQGYGQVTSVFKTAGDSSMKMKSNYQTSNSQGNANIDTQNAGHQLQEETNRAHMSYGAHQEPPEKNYEIAEQNHGSPEKIYATPEKNYEVEEAVSVMTHGRAHGVQLPVVTAPEDSTVGDFNAQHEQSQDPNSKFGYVVEGRNFRKYQVEERTPDGFIVGEYGVVSHDDGSLRGVRYTADGTINPRLIYDALVKFLSL
ncbi:hypothetical protein B7P43_G09993, partial [Cryptotermes secundus]